MLIVHQESPGLTAVPDLFIDEYMREANGEFVKCYIYLLRMAGDGGEGADLSTLADRLDLTERDVLRALRYWEKQGLLCLLRRDGQITGLKLLPVRRRAEAEEGPAPAPEEAAGSADGPAGVLPQAVGHSQTVLPPATALLPQTALPPQTQSEPPLRSTPQPLPEKSAVSAAEPPRPKAGAVTEEAILRLQEDEDFRQIVYVAEKYLARTHSVKDVQLFAYLYDELQFPEELIEYLIEYCVGGGHRTNRYMESVALGWHQEGIRTVKQAKEMHRAYSRENRQIMQAFGISGRVLTAEERRSIDRWLKQYHMPLEVIVEACNVTMSAIHQPSFEYAESILSGWHAAGVASVEDARTQQEKRRISRKKQAAGEKKTQPEAARNRFRNYEQRDVDYDAMLARGQWS